MLGATIKEAPVLLFPLLLLLTTTTTTSKITTILIATAIVAVIIFHNISHPPKTAASIPTLAGIITVAIIKIIEKYCNFIIL